MTISCWNWLLLLLLWVKTGATESENWTGWANVMIAMSWSWASAIYYPEYINWCIRCFYTYMFVYIYMWPKSYKRKKKKRTQARVDNWWGQWKAEKVQKWWLLVHPHTLLNPKFHRSELMLTKDNNMDKYKLFQEKVKISGFNVRLFSSMC